MLLPILLLTFYIQSACFANLRKQPDPGINYRYIGNCYTYCFFIPFRDHLSAENDKEPGRVAETAR